MAGITFWFIPGQLIGVQATCARLIESYLKQSVPSNRHKFVKIRTPPSCAKLNGTTIHLTLLTVNVLCTQLHVSSKEMSKLKSVRVSLPGLKWSDRKPT